MSHHPQHSHLAHSPTSPGHSLLNLPAGFVIAIDGPSGSGKSTLARHIAARFCDSRMAYIDTGAIYRTYALAAARAGVPTDDEAALTAFTEGAVIEFIPGEGADPAHVRFQVLINGQSANEAIRTDEASHAASKYAALPTVRAALLTVQRTLGAGRPRVLDGRDIGSVVFPDAAVKIFLEADEAERARRRQAELAARGETHSTVAIAQAQAERDRRDSERKTAPLTRAPGAVALDSTVLSPSELADEVEKLVAAVLHR